MNFSAQAADLAWDARHQLLYLSLPSSNGPDGNAVVALDPRTNTVVRSHRTGNEPGKLALSDDSRYLYVAIRGLPKVQRFRLPDLTLDLELQLGREDLGLPLIASDLLVAPGQPNTVVVAMGIDPTSSTVQAIRVFDNGTRRPDELGHIAGPCSSMQWDATGGRLFCAMNATSGGGLMEASFGPTGLRYTREFRGVFRSFGARMQFSPISGLIYGDDGTVFDPAAGRVVHRIDVSGPMVADLQRNRLYYASDGERVIRSFDATSYRPVAVAGAPAALPTRLVRWGDDGLALATASATVHLFGSSANSTFRGEIPRGTVSEKFVAAEANGLAWSLVHAMLYASIGQRASQMPNSVAVVDPNTGQVVRSSHVGSEPTQLAVSDDGQYLYVGLNRTGTILRLRLPGLEPDLTIPLGRALDGSLYVAGDIQVSPSNARTIAVSKLTGLGPQGGPLVIFDDAVARPLVSDGSTPLGLAQHLSAQWSGDGTKLYSSDHSLSFLYTLDVSSSGITLTDAQRVFLGARNMILERTSGLLFYGSGYVLNPATHSAAASYGPVDGLQNIAVDAAAGRVFLLRNNPATIPSNWELTAHDTARNVAVKRYSLTTYDSPLHSDFMQLQTGVFAFRSSFGVHIVRLDRAP